MSGMFGGGDGTSFSETPLKGLQIQSSAAGLPIPLVYGTTRVVPNLMWYADFTAIAHVESQGGGKGGGGESTYTTYTYTASFALGICEGPVAGITKVWIDKTLKTPSDLFTLKLGTYPQSTWSHFTTHHPTQAIGYQGIAYAAAANYDLGNRSGLPNHIFEVQGKYLLGSGVIDADPKDIVTDLLTNPHTGVPNAPALGDTTAYSNYCKATGILLSPSYSDASTAASILAELMQITNTAAYFSDGVLKLVPYGDASATGNGATYTPNLTPLANLDDDDFLGDSSADPVIVQRNAISKTAATSSEAYNQVTIEYLNRSNKYASEPLTVQDQVAIDTFGLRPHTITAHAITTPAVAGIVADLILQRYVYVRGQYEFKLGWQWCYLEPTDLVTLTDAMGLSLHPVRILSVEEDTDGTLTVLAEDAPPGVASHVVADVPEVGGYDVDYNAPAGSVSAVCLLEPPYSLAAGSGLEVWAGVSGPVGSTIWGGCHVWVSYDGATYRQMAVIDNPARIGHLSAAVAIADTSLDMVLDGMGGQLISASATDAAALHTLAYIGGDDPEFFAYEGATLTAENAYTLSGLVRGAYGSTIADHLIGDPFLRLDDALAKSGSLDLSMIGDTIHFKFQSFNVWGGGVEDLSTLTAYDYTIAGLQATGNAVGGLTATAMPGSAVLTKLSWTASPDAVSYEIDQSGDGITWQRTGETRDTTWADSALFGASTRFRVAAVRARAGSWSTSAFLNISFTGMWNANASTPMWNANAATPMWST